MQKNLEVDFFSYSTPLGGYGIVGNLWAKHLSRLGVDVYISGKFAPRPGTMEWEMIDEEEKALFQKPFKKTKIGINQSNPFDFDINTCEVRATLTMCESDRVSESWPQKLNAMDYIIVPNKFCQETFERSGVTKPIMVIPHGADTERYTYYERPKRDVFTFGIIGYLDAGTDRKGALDLIRAFASEFDKDEPLRLILKSSDPTFGYFTNLTDPRIKVIAEPYNYDQLIELYHQLDCFVFPSKAEGIGLPPMEAMLTGLPVILTKWSGMEDFALSSVSYPLTPVRFEPRPLFIEQNGNWAIVDVKEIMYWMRYVYEHQDEAREKGRKASAFIRQKYNWPNATRRLKKFLEEISG